MEWSAFPFAHIGFFDISGLIPRKLAGAVTNIAQEPNGLGRKVRNDVSATLVAYGEGFPVFRLNTSVLNFSHVGNYHFASRRRRFSREAFANPVASMMNDSFQIDGHSEFPLLMDLYFTATLRGGMSAILRFDATRPNNGVVLSSRMRRHISPAISRIGMGLAFFLRISRMALFPSM